MYSLSLDTSGDWLFIAAVVFVGFPRVDDVFHVASLNKKLRRRFIRDILSIIDSDGYGVCLRSDVRRKVRVLASKRMKKFDAWKIVLTSELMRIANHLRDKGLWPISAVFADREFKNFEEVLLRVFKPGDVAICKCPEVIFGDVLAYVNFKERQIIKNYRRIVEL